MSRVCTLDDDRRGAVESFVAEWLTDENVPSAGVALVDGDEVVYADGFGARDLESNVAASPDTLYGVASVTKSFVATSVLQLADEGHLEVGDPVTEYVDFFEECEGRRPSENASGDTASARGPPTVHELLSHTSGLPSDGASVALIARFVDGDTATSPLSSDADLHRNVRQSAGERADGDRFFYSNTGYTVLGKLVEAVDGRPLSEYVADEVLAPLGMDRSVIRGDPADYDDAMTPYRYDSGDLERTEFPVKGVGAAGGLLSTASDLASYLQFAMHGDEAVLPDALRELSQRAHATRRERIDGTQEQYGYGWMRRPFLGDELVEHGGSLSVSSAYVGFLEDAELGVAIAANTDPDHHPTCVGSALLALLSGESPEDVVPFYALREKCRRVAGRYESYRSAMTADVEAAGGNLEVTFETALGEESVTAFPESLDRTDLSFYTVGAGGQRVPLTFEPEESTAMAGASRPSAAAETGLDCFYQRWRLHEAHD